MLWSDGSEEPEAEFILAAISEDSVNEAIFAAS
jgi:hypothetical protein